MLIIFYRSTLVYVDPSDNLLLVVLKIELWSDRGKSAGKRTMDLLVFEARLVESLQHKLRADLRAHRRLSADRSSPVSGLHDRKKK